MATNYPAALDSLTNPAGTQTLASPDHALQHANSNDAIEAIQTTLGTTAGTSVLKNFAAGNFPARINSSNVLQQALSGTINSSVMGSPTVTSGTANSLVLGTPRLNGNFLNTSGSIAFNLFSSGTTTNYIQLGNTNNGVSPFIAAAGPSGDISLELLAQDNGKIVAGNGLVPTVAALTDAVGTLTPNTADGNVFSLSMGTTAGNRTFAAPTNVTDGQSITFRIKNNAAATGTIVWNAIYRFDSATGTATIGTAATWNYYGFRYNSIDTKWDFVGANKNII